MNIKSIVIGFLLGAAVVFALGATGGFNRYQVAVAYRAECNRLIIARIDTTTGAIEACQQVVTAIPGDQITLQVQPVIH